MKRRAVAFTLICLWFLSPAVARARPRAFDFSGASRSARLLDRGSPWTRGMAEGDRIRALASVSVTTSEEPLVPTHLWAVPLVLTGTGLLTGFLLCAFVSDPFSTQYDCGQAALIGLWVGAALGLGYLYLATCSESEGGCGSACPPEDEGCTEEGAARGSRQRSALRDARRKLTHAVPRGLPSLPLGLAPAVGFVNDRATFGLGGHF